MQVGELCLGILAVLMAINQGLRDAPHLRRALPQLRFPGWMNYGPLLLFIGGLALNQIMTGRLPWQGAAPARARFRAIPTAPVQTPIAEYAPVLRGHITLARVREIISQGPPARAEAILLKYLGTPMIASGKVRSRTTQEGNDRYTFYITDKTRPPVVYMIFSSSKNAGLSYVAHGDYIEGVCRVERLDATGIGLDGCVRMESGVVLPPP